jgi:branched-chain amino acid transport system substrate-binding protein
VAFPVSTHAPDQIVKGLQTFIDHGAHKIALLYCLEVSALCTYLSKEVQKSPIGKYIADTYQVSLVAPSYTSQCLRMKQSGIDAIWLGMDTAGAGRLVQDCANQGFKPPALLLGLDATSSMPQLPALSQALVPGATFPPVDVGVPAVARYLQAMATYGRGLGHSGATSFGWASAEMFGLAARNLSDNPTSAELFTALWKVRDEDLGGLIPPVTYVEGKGAQVRSCIFLWAVKDDRWNAPNGAKLSC